MSSNEFVEIRNKESNEPDEIDTHELMMTQIGKRDENDTAYSPAYLTNENLITADESLFVDDRVNLAGLLDAKDMYSFIRLLNPKAQYKKAYVCFDTRFISSANNDRTRLTWNFMNNNDINLGSINVLGTIRDIISIKVYKFNLPGFCCTSLARVSINFEEFQAQSFIGHEDRRFHIIAIAQNFVNEFGVVTQASPVIPSPVTANYRTQMYMQEPMNYGEFHFRKPVTIVDKITLSFGDPYNLISIPQDTYTCTQSSFIIDMITGNLVCLMLVPNLIPPVAGYNIDISGFTTTNPLSDAGIINAMNNTILASATIFGLPLPYNLSFTLFNSLYQALEPFPPLPIGTPQPFTIYISQNRTFVYTEMTYLDSTPIV